MTRFVVLASLATLATTSLLAPRLAGAQTLTAPATAPAPESAPIAAPYSPNTALALSLGATAAGAGMLAYGAFSDGDGNARATLVDVGVLVTYLGPSAGHVYTDELFTRGLGVRTVGAALIGASLLSSLEDCGFFEDDCETSALTYGLMVAGAAVTTAGIVDDIATAPMRAKRLNREARALSIAPQVAPGRAGVAVVGTF